MKYASINDIEIGNLVFGNSRGEYVVPRGVWQDVFCNFLERNDFSDYGFYNKGDEDYFENDTFIIRPYYWGDDEDIADLPNFVYKPTGFFMSWYKYPLRNAFASQDIKFIDFVNMLNVCERSLNESNINT